ncbi:hepatocyte growth factor-like protein [Limosa lapponica baueri]|uniref:Hepatocyte growth factor-like protein n=1 Tax=Limosa lapponica baueri TaxID=1758121 RepID=A0A2I0THH2_LIMLA|nr:hepatocyte growth factor-like protein [Limosa lapponica baueri]
METMPTFPSSSWLGLEFSTLVLTSSFWLGHLQAPSMDNSGHRSPLNDFQRLRATELLAVPAEPPPPLPERGSVEQCAQRCATSLACRAFHHDRQSHLCQLLPWTQHSPHVQLQKNIHYDLYQKKDYLRDCIVADGTSYRGTRATTEKGLHCQHWRATTPHDHRCPRIPGCPVAPAGTADGSVLNVAWLPVLAHGECNAALRGRLKESELCTAPLRTGVGACEVSRGLGTPHLGEPTGAGVRGDIARWVPQGDYGGPLACLTADCWVLEGVITPSRVCARTDQPSLFIRVSLYVDWIHKVMKMG